MRTFFFSTIVGAALLCGCAKEGYQTAEKANDTLTDTKSELIRDKAQLKTTVDALDDLVYHTQNDMRPQFMKFSNAVDALDKTAANTRKTSMQLVEQRASYLSQWRTETMKNPDSDLRQRAMNRISETRERYDAINGKLLTANSSFEPLLLDLKAIRDYISTDLTSNGIKSISDRATSAKNKSITTNHAIDAAVNEIDVVKPELTPTTTPSM